MHHMHRRRSDSQQSHYLAFGESRNGDDRVRAGRGVARLFGEADAKLGRGIIAGHKQQVVKGYHGAIRHAAWQALVQAMKDVRYASGTETERTPDKPPPDVGRQGFGACLKVAMRTVAESEACFRMGGGQAIQDFSRIETYSGEFVTDTVGGVE